MKKFNMLTQRLDEYFSECVESNNFFIGEKIGQTFQEVILPHALADCSKLSLNSDNKFFVEIYEDKDGIAWLCEYTYEDITYEEYMLYLYRLSIDFYTIEDEWINDSDGNLKRIIKKIRIDNIHLQDIEELKTSIDTIIKNNLIDNYDKEQIKVVKQYIDANKQI